MPPLFAEFGFEPGVTAADVAASVWPLPGFAPAYFNAFAACAQQVGAGRVLDRMLPSASRAFAEADPERRLALLAEAFLKASGEPYSTTWIFGKPLIARLPDLPERYEAACTAIRQVRDRLALLRMLENTRAALTVADWLIARYEQLKTGRGFLDFNDLITRTVRLLARQDAGPWILYKLDKGIDHILIDEAQDTSPDQWGVVGRLTEEFFAGAGARDHVRRTVFAVGDEKQSIYSFQGAAPESFAASGFAFSEKVRGAEGRFEHVKLTLSFRSTEDVLAAVDRVFARDAARRGLTFAGDPIEHTAIRCRRAGLCRGVAVTRRRRRAGAGRLDDRNRSCHRARRTAGRKHRAHHRALAEFGRNHRRQRQTADARRRARSGAGSAAASSMPWPRASRKSTFRWPAPTGSACPRISRFKT